MKPSITIVTPVFNEEKNLETYHSQVSEILLSNPEFNMEIILVDDGSLDNSWTAIRALCSQDKRFRGVRLSRNWGAHVAIQAGLAHMNSDAAVILACDLQDPPDAALRLCHAWRETKANIVWGVRESRQDSFSKRLLSLVFNKLLKRYAFDRKSQFTSGSFLLADKKVVDAYQRFDERQRITFAMIAWMGFSQARVGYSRMQRTGGRSGWSFWKMLNASFDTLLSYSDMPIKLISMSGIALFLASIGLGIYIVISYLQGHPKTGWHSLSLMLTFFFGLLFLFLGVLGEYLRRIYIEVLKRPAYIVVEQTF